MDDNVSKSIVVAEKPSVARDLARVLGCGKKVDGFLYSDSYVVTWAVGHLLTLKEPEDYDARYKKWSRENLPILPDVMGVKPVPKTLKQLNVIKKLINHKNTKEVICATDSGREGELIFRYIYNWSGCKRPVKRLWISSLTDEAIRNGFMKLKDGTQYDNLYASAKCRSHADWIVGMNGTRAFTLSSGELLPVGRVQTPTLAMIVQREKEIKAFVPVEYYEVKAEFETRTKEVYSGVYYTPVPNPAETLKKEGDLCNQEKDGGVFTRIPTYDEAKEIAKRVKGKPGMVHEVVSEEKKQLPPQLFDLTELQRECNRKLGFSAQKTLSIAQSLYESHKMVTYPRTDSRYLSDDILPKLPLVVASFNQAQYKPFAEKAVVTKNPRIFNSGKVTDHHAIIPTGSKKSLDSLSNDEKAVYDRIVRNFLAAFFPAQVYWATTVTTKVDRDLFISKGRTVMEDGWTALYAHEKKAETEPPLPELKKGYEVKTLDAKPVKKKTEPPKPHTEATLLSMMENAGRLVDDESLKEALKSSGLGTPATRAQIIEKLISSGYVTRSKKNLLPTEKGIKLIQIVPAELKEAKTTAKWEKALTKIAEGSMSEERFMESIRKFAVYLVDCTEAVTKTRTIHKEDE